MSTITVENMANLCGLTLYKEFFISISNDQFVKYHAGFSRSYAVTNRVSGASAGAVCGRVGPDPRPESAARFPAYPDFG
jgi:hypothetical protein